MLTGFSGRFSCEISRLVVKQHFRFKQVKDSNILRLQMLLFDVCSKFAFSRLLFSLILLLQRVIALSKIKKMKII